MDSLQTTLAAINYPFHSEFSHNFYVNNTYLSHSTTCTTQDWILSWVKFKCTVRISPQIHILPPTHFCEIMNTRAPQLKDKIIIRISKEFLSSKVSYNHSDHNEVLPDSGTKQTPNPQMSTTKIYNCKLTIIKFSNHQYRKN